MIQKLKSLKNHQGFRKYFKNTSWLLAEKILRMIVGLFVGIWVARYLGPEQFGLFSYAQSFVGLFIAIAMMGLNSLVVKEIINHKEKLNEILGTSIVLKLIGSVIAFIMILISIQFTTNDFNTNLLIFIIMSSLIFQSFNVIEFYFQSQVISQYIVYANAISLLVSSLLKIILILTKAPLIYFAIALSFDSLILATGFIYFYKKHNFLLKEWKFNKQIALKFLYDGWPLILSGMSFVLYNNIDKIMLQNMLDSYSVGIYSAATRLVIVWYFLPGLIVTSFMPVLVKSFEDNDIFIIRLTYLSSLLIWFSIFLILVYIFLSDFIISITYGKDFIQASETMIILIWSTAFIFFNTVWNRWMLIKGDTKITFYYSLLTAILNIIFNYIFIHTYGIIGASYALLVSLFISSFIFYVIIDFKVLKLYLSALTLEYLWRKR